LLKKTFRDIFIFYQPKELISGDFYWLYTSGNLIYFAVADCTGHGVPGAFMSILSIALLNDIVKTTSENNNTALILEKLREKIVNALHQNDINSESKDGLDISISIIDKEKNILYFSGAHNSLLILNNDILEIKADKIPVSMSLKMKNFSNHTIKIKPNDTFYMFTDGFSDQFGYLSNRKYYKTKLKEFLYEIHEQPFDIQENLITNEFFNWMGNLSQVDDVLVVGFKI
jgi:serine phosphatase RsbU (regulator of sigma subunit)